LDALGTLVLAGGIGDDAPTVGVISNGEECMIAKMVCRILNFG
jgi:hypothetical protein